MFDKSLCARFAAAGFTKVNTLPLQDIVMPDVMLE
jgi:hypothetical protein